MPLPDLVIGGAPKCGTTSLFAWLADHPGVCASSRKETFYLIDSDSPLRSPDGGFHQHGLRGYERLFSHCAESGRRVLEGTTHYLYHRTALEVLAGLETGPDIVFLLREPAARVYSSFRFSQETLGAVDRSLSFPEYLELQGERPEELARRVTAPRSSWVLNRDVGYGRYIDHLEPWLERFGRERVHVLLFEDLRDDPRRFVRELARRLGLDEAFYEDHPLPRENPTLAPRSRLLHAAARAVRRLAPGGLAGGGARRLYWRLQRRRREPATAADLGALAELRASYGPWNDRLALALDLDLSKWRGDAAGRNPV